jgi:predicted RNA-binding protein with PUA-like domain
MNYWLLKTEPSKWSWQNQVRKQIEHWDGVRNPQASSYLKSMKKGNLAFFYHSGEEKEIVGIVEIVKEYYPDFTDKTGRFGMVDVKAFKELSCPVSLKDIKEEPRLSHLALCRQPRLSVMPIDEPSWKLLLEIGREITLNT